MLDAVESRFREVAPREGFCSLRFVDERNEVLSVRMDVPEPAMTWRDTGVMNRAQGRFDKPGGNCVGIF